MMKSSNPWKSITETGVSGTSSNPTKGSEATGAIDAIKPFSRWAIRQKEFKNDFIP